MTLAADGSTSTGLDSVDPSTHPAHDAASFRRLRAAKAASVAAEAEIVEAVEAARDAGDSWAIIGIALGMSRQAARQRFA